MAIVVSDSKEMTVIILEKKDEAIALERLLDLAPPELGVVLDELTNALTSLPYESEKIDNDQFGKAVAREVRNQSVADWLGVNR